MTAGEVTGEFQLVKPLTENLKPTLVGLARMMFALNPEAAERGWRQCGSIDGRPGQWFAIDQPGHRAYILAGEAGRFSVGKPDGVDEATLPVIDETGPAPELLHVYLDWLAGEVVKVDAEWEGSVGRIVAAARAVDSSGWVRGELSGLTMGLVGKSADVSDAAFASELDGKTRERYFAFEIPGTLVATICLITRIALVAAPVNVLHKALTMAGALNLFATPQVFLRDVLRKVAKVDGGLEAVAKACASLQEDAESFGNAAESAKDLGSFDGSIYASVPLAYAAQQGFEFLAEEGGGKDGKYRMLAHVCEERVAPALATISTSFRNAMDWRALGRHRATIAAARAKDGDGAAEMLADQYTTQMLLYPRFLREFLLGETDDLAFRAEE